MSAVNIRMWVAFDEGRLHGNIKNRSMPLWSSGSPPPPSDSTLYLWFNTRSHSVRDATFVIFLFVMSHFNFFYLLQVCKSFFTSMGVWSIRDGLPTSTDTPWGWLMCGVPLVPTHLVYVMNGCVVVEPHVQVVQHGDHLDRSHCCCYVGKGHDVREENGHFLELLWKTSRNRHLSNVNETLCVNRDLKQIPLNKVNWVNLNKVNWTKSKPTDQIQLSI